MKVYPRGDDQLWIRVDLSRGRYTEIVVTKRRRVEISADAVYGEDVGDVALFADALALAVKVARVAEQRDDWIAAITGG